MRIPPPASTHPIVMGQRGPIARDQWARERRDDDEAGGHGQEVHRCLVRRRADHNLEVQGSEEEDGERPEVGAKATKVEPANGARRNMLRSSIGLFTLSSVTTNARPDDSAQSTKSATIQPVV